MTAGTVCTFFKNNPRWLRLQKWVMALTLGGLGVRLLTLA
jgi:threonine/homoserine/homoserine lactone efflux protein